MAKSADEARAQAAKADAARALAAKKAADAKAAADKAAAAKKATANKITAAKTAAAAEAKRKEVAYIASFKNPITSQYDPRIAENAIVKPENYGVFPINGPTWQQLRDAAEPAAIGKVTEFEPAGKILRYKTSRTGYRIPVLTDGKGGEIDGKEEIDPDYKAPDKIGGNLDNPAFSIVAGILKNYDMAGVAESIAKIRADYPEIASDDILSLLKFDTRYNGPYLERFAGNAELMKKGLPTLDDATYLKTEKEYDKILKSYGVGALSNRKQYATLIGNSMDAVDVSDRLKVGYERLKADKYTEQAFRKFFPSIGDGDIVAAMLNPEEMLPVLERKAAAAEIGGSYLAQGLESSKASAESLAAYGITKAGAQAGVRYIAQNLPRGQFLTAISGETGINYTQQTAEDITFKKSVEAQKQEDILKQKEINRFSGSSGRLASKDRAQGII